MLTFIVISVRSGFQRFSVWKRISRFFDVRDSHASPRPDIPLNPLEGLGGRKRANKRLPQADGTGGFNQWAKDPKLQAAGA